MSTNEWVVAPVQSSFGLFRTFECLFIDQFSEIWHASVVEATKNCISFMHFNQPTTHDLVDTQPMITYHVHLLLHVRTFQQA